MYLCNHMLNSVDKYHAKRQAIVNRPKFVSSEWNEDLCIVTCPWCRDVNHWKNRAVINFEKLNFSEQFMRYNSWWHKHVISNTWILVLLFLAICISRAMTWGEHVIFRRFAGCFEAEWARSNVWGSTIRALMTSWYSPLADILNSEKTKF